MQRGSSSLSLAAVLSWRALQRWGSVEPCWSSVGDTDCINFHQVNSFKFQESQTVLFRVHVLIYIPSLYNKPRVSAMYSIRCNFYLYCLQHFSVRINWSTNNPIPNEQTETSTANMIPQKCNTNFQRPKIKLKALEFCLCLSVPDAHRS